MSRSISFSDADFFTVGAIGEPGSRVFLLQVAQGSDLLTVKAEKQQISALCQYLGELLADLPSPGHLPTDLALREPAEPEWIAGGITVNYEEDSDAMHVSIEETTVELEDAELDFFAVAELAAADFVVSRDQAAAVAVHGTSVVEAGRAPCPLCGYPLQPAGHACPRANGHRPPAL